MATYSRSQTTTQTSQSAAMPSMDISSLLVKTMENVMNDKEDGDKDFEKTITDAINNSDLLKDKTKNDNDKELSDLLKDKKNSDKELSTLLKDTKNEKKKGTVKSDSDKISNTLGKIVSGGIIGSTIAGIMGSKGVGGTLKGAVSGAVTGTGKVAGGLVSGVGNIGGSAIAGIGKLFGPVGAVIGKFVGTAVAAPFKLVGGTITAAIGGLGKLLSMPLKELVTKGVLIVGVLSQLFVFFEGLLAKFMAEKDIKWIDFMAKIKSSIDVIPKLMGLQLERIASNITILGKPIYKAGLDNVEKDEYKTLGDDIKRLEKMKKKGVNKDAILNEAMTNSYTLMSGMGKYSDSADLQGIGYYDFQNSDAESWEKYKQSLLSLGAKRDNEMGAQPGMYEGFDTYTDYIQSYINNIETSMQLLNTDDLDKLIKEKQDRISQLENKRDNYFAVRAEELQSEQDESYRKHLIKDTAKYASKKDKNGKSRGLSAFQQQQLEDIGGEGTAAEVKAFYADKYNEELTTRDPTGAERFSANQYKAWTDSIATAIEHGFQNTIGVKIDLKQKFDQHNPTIKK